LCRQHPLNVLHGNIQLFLHLIREVPTTPQNPHKVLKIAGQNSLKAEDMFPFVVQQNLGGPSGPSSTDYRHVLDLPCPCKNTASPLQPFSLVSLLFHISLDIMAYNSLDPPICQTKSYMCSCRVRMGKLSQMGGPLGYNELKHAWGQPQVVLPHQALHPNCLGSNHRHCRHKVTPFLFIVKRTKR
jgi:hypothetical protein